MNQSNNQLPKSPEPYWRESLDFPSFSKLEDNLITDVVIVGGGITGITTAYLLTQEGKSVTLLDAGKLLNGTTGHTTAKITAQHDLIYDELINHIGHPQAKLYYQANAEALKFIKETVEKNAINCDLSEEDAYIYTNSDKYTKKIEKEYKAYQKLGIEGELLSDIPLDIPIKKALVMKKQAQFHPLKYLAYLVKELQEKGCKIYENTVAVDVEEGHQPILVTRDGYKITADYVISASHFPFNDTKGLYFSRMYAERSYLIGAKTDKPFPGGMYLSAESPKRSLRYTPMNGENLILIAGEKHKTGQGIDTLKHYEALQEFGQETFGLEEITYRWSAQDLTTLDKVPYVGTITPHHPTLLVATGFRKWGMTNGTASAKLLSDIVLERENPYKALYDPSRFNADPSIKEFLKINGDVTKHLIKDKFKPGDKEIEDLKNDEGAMVRVNGQLAGAYKSGDGTINIVDTTCTHLGCEVHWNHGDRTWDCPCHGSRFSVTGEVVEGPAKKPLTKIEYK